ncbi:hypothetical protein D9V86_12330 [Bacteroidetes/Chlorobi group bacterium ChocPot_Mid]|jgi:hypothetical protein|nr:MAG: hypothetical protein D9V86_12330 [Bacteroidetes/Chlorobi group bacterium ChocPot_Mid]
MSYSRLIHEYLDSQLDAVNEDVLFAELAKNSDLRVEFNQQVQLQNVAMSDMRTISPPTESTNTIFNSLGFSIPSGDYLRRIAPNPDASIAVRPVGTAVSRFFKKHIATVAAVIITASLTTAVFMLTDNRFASQPENKNIAQVQNDIPVISSKDNTNQAIQKGNNFAYSGISNAIKNIPNSQESNNSNSSNQSLDEKPVNLASMFTEASQVSTTDKISSLKMINNNNPVNNEIIDPFVNTLKLQPSNNFSDGKIAIILTYANKSSNVAVDINGQNLDYNLTAVYKLNDNLYIGMTAGSEQFAMRFIKEGYEYQKLPNLSYLGLTVKGVLPLKDFNEIGNLLTPYIQLTGGSTNLGWFMGKLQTGLTLTPYSKWAVNVGWEYSTFLYNVNGFKSTGKNGFVIGAGLSF